MLVSKKTMTLLVVLVGGYFAYQYFMKKKNGMNGTTATNGNGASA